jgi:hypothetical protein
MTADFIYLEPEKTTPGVLMTGVNVTFNCAGFSRKLVTGNVIGHIENPNCGTFQASHSISFEKSSNGVQKYMQITTAGEKFDLISNNDEGGSYLTSSQTGTGTLTYTNNRVKLTC